MTPWMSRHLGQDSLVRIPAVILGAALFALLTLPILSLVLASSPADLMAGVGHELFLSALLLSARTTLVSLVLVILMGTPLSWWLATAPPRRTGIVEVLVHLPIVMPPAVMGVALLTAFGRSGLVGRGLDLFGLHLPFTTTAVIIAQVCVSAPFYVQSASTAFRKVDLDLVLVARTLGASRAGAFLRVAVPLALPGLVAGAALSWARSLGEFGATLFFAGNLMGTTQTMPLAIFSALESDVRVAVAIALALTAMAVVLLLLLRYAPAALFRQRGEIET